MSVDEIDHAVLALSPGEKYKLLSEHFVPASTFAFPKVFDSGCNRSFQVKWLKKYPWLVYSKVLDGGFCKYLLKIGVNAAYLLINPSPNGLR